MQKLTKQKRIRSIVAASSGNLVEWFDFIFMRFLLYILHTTFLPRIIQQFSKSMPLESLH